MNRLLNSFCHRLKPLLYKRINSRITKNFAKSELPFQIQKNEILYTAGEIINNLHYKDENWNQIKYLETTMWNDLFKINILKKAYPKSINDNDCRKYKIESQDNEIKCKSKGKKNDWILLKFGRRLTEPCLVEFDAKIMTETSEFQFAFMYQNLGSRYRFNLKNNKILSFEVVYGGGFHNDIISEPFSLNINQFYNFKIQIDPTQFQYLVNDKLILSIDQIYPIIDGGEIAFILWDSDTSDIDAVYKNISIYSIDIKKKESYNNHCS